MSEIEELRASNRELTGLLARERAEIERLTAAQDKIMDIIADWANEEGISFDATTRLSRALEGK